MNSKHMEEVYRGYWEEINEESLLEENIANMCLFFNEDVLVATKINEEDSLIKKKEKIFNYLVTKLDIPDMEFNTDLEDEYFYFYGNQKDEYIKDTIPTLEDLTLLKCLYK